MRPDQPLDLAALHSEVPLRDSDYAAIRARVRAELARRERRRFLPLFLRLAFAAAIVAVIAVLVMPRGREVPVRNVVQQTPMPAPLKTPPPPAAQRAEERPAPARIEIEIEKVAAARPKRRAPQRSTRPVLIAEPMRIEMQTADPDVRIIWIVQSETERESS